MIDVGKARVQLILHEGDSQFPYHDTVGKLTIGVGRNLDDVGLSPDERAYLLTNDIMKVTAVYDREIPWWNKLSDVRGRVLLDMGVNMGPYFFRKWPIFTDQVWRGMYAAAAKNMRGTLWYRQVGAREDPPQRGFRLATMMETGLDYTR